MLLLGKLSVCVCASSTLKSIQAAGLPFHSFPLNHLSFTASLASSQSHTVRFPVRTGMLVGVSPASSARAGGSGPGTGVLLAPVALSHQPKAGLDFCSHTHGRFSAPSQTGDVWKLRTSLPSAQQQYRRGQKGRKTIIKTSNPRETVLPWAALSGNRDLASP